MANIDKFVFKESIIFLDWIVLLWNWMRSAIHWSNGEKWFFQSQLLLVQMLRIMFLIQQSDNVCGDSISIYVNELDTSFINITACDSYAWNGDNLRTESGTYFL